MRKNNSQVQFRSSAVSPVVYQVTLPMLEMSLASLGVSVLLGLLSVLGGAGWLAAVKTGGVVFVVLVALLVALRFGKAFLWGIEAMTDADLNGDQVIGKAEPHFVYVRGTPGRNSELDDLRDFTQGLYTRGTGRRAWMGSRLPGTGHVLTRGMFDRFCSVLLEAGILEDLGGGRGTELTCSLDEALQVLGLD